MTQSTFCPRLPRSCFMGAAEARAAMLPLLVLAAFTVAERLPAVGWGPGLPLAVALTVAALVRPRRAALVMALGVGLVALGVGSGETAPALAGLLVVLLSPLAARR
ncbi:hypothetical protein F8S09_01730 [Deinococcus sp. SDU3-2]|uniref:Uncharacterized protein n=1 Tax=Deinococcus terrestris TaxID=2651870 RepID=A0A7X1TQ71_9DEIO|nr:hypothetical protein [Deinococcus terrestris]MPY65413.1 hypothetical protein [Deinococcus terrestris]